MGWKRLMPDGWLRFWLIALTVAGGTALIIVI